MDIVERLRARNTAGRALLREAADEIGWLRAHQPRGEPWDSQVGQ